MIILASPYFFTNIYDFTPLKPFQGNNWINPYQNVEKGIIKANFHMHSHAWAGLTYGENTPKEMQKMYVNQGYDVAPVSNYMQITKNLFSNLIDITSYEHGLNLKKVHQIAIGSKNVSFFDFNLWQNTSQKQQIINNLVAHGSKVQLAHPSWGNSYTAEDLKKLSGYSFFEVFNHFAESPEAWDTSLVAGHLSYILANDDSHQADLETTAKIYSLIFSNSRKSRHCII